MRLSTMQNKRKQVQDPGLSIFIFIIIKLFITHVMKHAYQWNSGNEKSYPLRPQCCFFVYDHYNCHKLVSLSFS